MKKTSIFLLLLAGTLAGLPGATAEETCAVVGSYPYAKIDQALAKAVAARTAGFAKAAVFDTRDTADLAWGSLAVVALRTSDKAVAGAALKTLRKARIKAYLRGCELGRAEPIAKRADLKPLPTLPKAALSLNMGSLEGGCHGWSAKQNVALCVLGSGSIQSGPQYGISFLPSSETLALPGVPEDELPRVDAKIQVATGDRKALAKRLRNAGFVVLPEPVRSLDRPGTVSLALPRVSVRYGRKHTGREGDGQTGVWSTYDDTVQVRCGGAWVDAIEESVQNATAQISVTPIPGGRYALVVYSYDYGIEGDQGDGATAVVLDGSQEGCGIK